jgi:predicted small metal-binding protein
MLLCVRVLTRVRKEEDKVRMLECPCGIHLKARNDAELAREVLTHAREEHNQLNLTEERAREMVARHSEDTEDAST